MKKILFVLLLVILTFMLTVNSFAVAGLPAYTVNPSYIGYSTRNSTYYPKVWDGDDYIYVTNDNVETNPATLFASFTISPEFELGVIYNIDLAYYTFSRADEPVIEEPISLYSVLFWNDTFTKYYTFPAENIVVSSNISQRSNTRYLDFYVQIFLNIDEKVDLFQLAEKPNLTVEWVHKQPNGTQIRFKNNGSTVGCNYNDIGFSTYVSNSLQNLGQYTQQMDEHVVLGTQKIETAIDNMPGKEYDWVNGEFGSKAQSSADDLFNHIVNDENGLSPIQSLITPTLQSVYDSVSTHEANFCIILPDTTVPFFDDVRILDDEGEVALYNYLPVDVSKKFDDVLPIVRGITSISAILGLLYWVLPKNMLGANKGD